MWGWSLEAELGLDTSALHHARKACRRERRPPLAGEHERRLGILLPLQLAQGPHFIADNGMGETDCSVLQWLAPTSFIGDFVMVFSAPAMLTVRI